VFWEKKEQIFCVYCGIISVLQGMYYLDVMRLELVYNGRKSCFPLLQKCLHFFYFVPLCNVIKANFIVLHDSGVNSFCTYCC